MGMTGLSDAMPDEVDHSTRIAMVGVGELLDHTILAGGGTIR